MTAAPIPGKEAQRMAASCCLNLQFTPAERRFDRVTPTAPQGASRCSHAIQGEASVNVVSLLQDPRFADRFPVKAEANAGFYDLHPIYTVDRSRFETSASVCLHELLVRAKGKAMRFLVGIVACLFICGPSYAVGLAALSDKDAVSGLKDALTQGSAAAIGRLGAENGFLGNDRVKIPLPDALRRVESGLKMLGMQRQAKELIVAMNRAAEQAVPEAKQLLVGAIKNMSVQDVKGILTGGDTAATDYFRKTTSESLAQAFLPIVTKATKNVGLAEKYNKLAAKGEQMGVVDAKQAKIEDYVTQKALDGLFLMIADQEKAIRSNPVGAATGMAQKVFGMLGK